jgi:uncharacterized protein YcbX
MPTVTRFSIAPVRSLGLEHPSEIDLTELGVREDRRFYLTDANNRLVDRLQIGSLVQIAAHTDPEATTLRLTFPDGLVVDDEVRLGEPVETPVHGRTAVGHLVDGPWAAALSTYCGREIRLVRCDRVGGTRSRHPATLISDGSLSLLGAHLGGGKVDGRRFRMLIELDDGRPHEEDTWIGGRIALGETILEISAAVPRCAITTQDPDTGVRDLDTLRTIIDYRGIRNEKDVDFGVWGEVEWPGRIRLGDEVRVLSVPTAVEAAAAS